MNYTLTLFKLLSSKIIFNKLLGIKNEAIKDRRANKEPIKKTIEWELIQTNPKSTGINTAAIWLIVNETPAVLAISFGSAIFWKYVLIAIANAKKTYGQ